MDRKTIAWIWGGGAVLMVLIYLFGPQHFLLVVEQAIGDSFRWLSDMIDTLAERAFEVVRAAAIALYVVFVVLALLSMSRGVRAGGMLFVVSVVFLLLVHTDWYSLQTKWLTAALLTAVAALIQTQRLLHSPGRRDATDPWGIAVRKGNRAAGPRTPAEPR